MNEDFLDKKLNERKEQNAFRQLRLPDGKTDFCSNDYLGIATNGLIESAQHAFQGQSDLRHGSSGSRLLAGNYPLVEETERLLAAFHDAETGLIFNSGYDANLGVLSSIPQRGDTILYDYLSHASIRDGIRLSFAQAHSFAHNDLQDLERRLRATTGAHPPVTSASSVTGAHSPTTSAPSATGAPSTDTPPTGNLFVVTESVFSMDGDQAPLSEIVALCQKYNAHLIIDEAHATGVVGPRGAGLVQEKNWQHACLARIHTFGKALGCHGAVVLGSNRLKDYLVNFSRAFIYTTALPPSGIQAIRTAYDLFPRMDKERMHLQGLITRFHQTPIAYQRVDSTTPIQVVIVPGNEAIKALAARLQTEGLDVRPILYPTVPRGSERLRIVFHAFNTTDDIDRLLAMLV